MTDASPTIPWDEYSAYREVIAHPEFAKEERFTLDQLWQAARSSEVLFRGWPFIFFDERFTRMADKRIETTVDNSDIRDHASFETWQLWQSGLWFHRALMDEASYAPALKRGKIIDFTITIYHISEAVGSLWRLYSALGVEDNETISIEFRYMDCQDRRVDTLEPRRFPPRTNHGGVDPIITRRKDAPLGIWRASDADLAVEIATEVFQRFGWTTPNVDEIRKIAHEFLAKPMFNR